MNKNTAKTRLLNTLAGILETAFNLVVLAALALAVLALGIVQWIAQGIGNLHDRWRVFKWERLSKSKKP